MTTWRKSPSASARMRPMLSKAASTWPASPPATVRSLASTPTWPDSSMRRPPRTTTAWLKPYCRVLNTLSGLRVSRGIKTPGRGRGNGKGGAWPQASIGLCRLRAGGLPPERIERLQPAVPAGGRLRFGGRRGQGGRALLPNPGDRFADLRHGRQRGALALGDGPRALAEIGRADVVDLRLDHHLRPCPLLLAQPLAHDRQRLVDDAEHVLRHPAAGTGGDVHRDHHVGAELARRVHRHRAGHAAVDVAVPADPGRLEDPRHRA